MLDDRLVRNFAEAGVDDRDHLIKPPCRDPWVCGEVA